MSFTCCVIGSGQLPIQCSRILLENGHLIKAVITKDPAFIRWAHQNGILSVESLGQLNFFKFDYLFSIVNEQKLSAEEIGFPFQAAINYHDGPLPKYAGIHATSWAILNKEISHGITWHLISTTLDAGDILKQSYFPIETNDTALSLNAKCYQAAVNSFSELIDELVQRKNIRVPQLLDQRTFFSWKKKPEANGLINWFKAAEEIVRSYRAFYFGDYDNRFSSSKFIVHNQCFVILKMSSLTAQYHALLKPGEIVRITEHAVQIATGLDLIAIEAIAYIDGRLLSLHEWVQSYNLKEGDILPCLNKEAEQLLQKQSSELFKEEAFWIKQWIDFEVTSLPYNNTIPSQSNKRYKQEFLLKGNSFPQASLKSVLLTLVLIYLYRITHNYHLTLGVTSENSDSYPALFFADVLPFNFIIDSTQTFMELWDTVKQQLEVLESHKTYLKDLPLRYTSLKEKATIFPIIFHNNIEKEDKDDFITASDHAQLIIKLNSDKKSYALELNLAWDEMCQPENLLPRMGHHLQKLMRAAIVQPNIPIHQLSFLTDHEKKWLLDQRGTSIQETDWFQKTISQIFKEVALQYPHHIAIVYKEQKITYIELDKKSDLVAYHLHKNGVKPQSKIAIYISRSPEAIIAMLAILKIGGIYVPIDPEYPDLRAQYIFHDTDCLLVLTIDKFYEKLKQLLQHNTIPMLLNMSKILTRTKYPKYQLVKNQPNHNDLAYILYTSGSTGQPKGVMVPCQGIIRLVKYQPYFIPTSQDTLLHLTQLSFDISMFEIWGALLNGAKLLILPNKIVDPYLLAETIKTWHPIVFSTPSFFKQVISLIPAAYDMAGLLILGGESVDPAPVYRLLQRKRRFNLNIKIINAYGPTENTIVSTCYLIESIDNSQKSIPIGKPISGTTAYVLDERQALVPIGVPGELCLGGLGLSPGYLNKPELNETAFFDNPYNISEDKKLYKTGDIVKWREDGNLDFIGRSDAQIKLRGFRIELYEIEAKLKIFPNVQEAIVLLDKQRQCLVAYLKNYFLLKGKKKKATFLIKIREMLEKNLPSYMIPAHFFILKQFPLTIHNKIDHKALLKLSRTRTRQQLSKNLSGSPVTYIEQQLHKCYQTILGIKQVGIYDSFFRLGGNSLSAMELIVKIKNIFNVFVPFHRLFDFPNIHQLAIFIEMLSAKNLQTEDKIIALPLNQKSPLSFSQEALWLFEQLTPDTSVYNIPILIELKGQLNLQAIQKSLDKLIERHLILRTSFFLEDDQIMQKAIDGWKLNLIQYDISKTKNTLGQLLKSLACTPFSISDTTPPLIRAYLIKIKTNDYRLLIVFHHLIADLQSINIFSQELALFYNLDFKKQSFLPSDLPIQYKDYSHWQRLTFKKDTLKIHLEYWKKQLANSPQLTTLHLDYVRPSIQRYKGKVFCLPLSENLLTQLNQLAIQHDSTLFMVLLSAFLILLRNYIQQEDMVIGIPTNGRNIKGLENIIGMFVSILPLRIRFDPSIDFITMLTNVKSIFLEAHAHQNISFASLVEILNLPTSRSWNPIFQIIFNMQQSNNDQFNFEGLVSKNSLVNTDTSKFDLSLDIVQQGTKYYANFEYNTDLFNRSTILELGRSFNHLLSQISENSHLLLNQFSILDEHQFKKIMVKWNKTEEEYPIDRLPHQLFEIQVNHTPDAVAIITENETITYNSLNKKANCIAHYLMKLGVRPEKIVVLYLDRSIAMIASILAILKAGGAYLPIEPGYPRTRLDQIMSESKPTLILTHSQFANNFTGETIPIIKIDTECHFSHYSTSNPKSIVGLDNPVSVIYTSGSTGQPKGVVNLHRGALNHLYWMKKIYSLNKNDRVLQKTTYMFDASFGEIFLPLISEASLVLPKPDEHKDIFRIIELINQYQISIIQFVPSQLALFVEAIQRGDCLSLKQVWCGGEFLSTHLSNQFLDRCHAQLHNLYGTTETSDDTTHWLCHKMPFNKNIPIGKPISNTQCFVLDEHLRPVPIGVPGELYIGGLGLARGYLNNPQLTASKFIINPFKINTTAKEGALLYKTGDKVKWLPTGELVFLTRVDNQVQIRGFRVELNEIETVFLKHPDVKQVVILSEEHDGISTNLIAYIVLKQQIKNSIGILNIKSFLTKYLPTYMLPTQIVTVSHIPLTTTGKIDRYALLALESAPINSAEVVRASTATEEKIRSLWSSLLQIKQHIHLEDDFFNLGGHSLAAARLMIHIQRLFGVKLPLSTLFEYSTLGEFSQFIDHSFKATKSSSLVEIFPPHLKITKNYNKKRFPAFFFIHPLGGSVFCYRQLAHLLVNAMKGKYDYQPFYAFEAKGLYQDHAPEDDIVRIAQNYVVEMQKLQKSGPYVIGGWSFGGLIAAEMVRQLEKLGETVLTLILIDSTADIEQLKKIDSADDAKILEFYEKLFEVKIKNKTNNLTEKLFYLIEQGKTTSNKNYTSEEIAQILKVVRAHIKSIKNFKLSLMNTNILLIKAEQTYHHTLTSGWDQYTSKQVSTYTVTDADHWTIMGDGFIQKTAAVLENFLKKLFANLR